MEDIRATSICASEHENGHEGYEFGVCLTKECKIMPCQLCKIAYNALSKYISRHFYTVCLLTGMVHN